MMDGDPTLFVDYAAAPGVTEHGGPPPATKNGGPVCPVCGHAAGCGYGFGLGAGIGAYWYCGSDSCSWSYKVLDEE